jgi:hypothetical protein
LERSAVRRRDERDGTHRRDLQIGIPRGGLQARVPPQDLAFAREQEERAGKALDYRVRKLALAREQVLEFVDALPGRAGIRRAE